MTEKQQEQEDNGEIDEGKLGSFTLEQKIVLVHKLTKRNDIYNTVFFIGL